jgi:hypothetical protein
VVSFIIGIKICASLSARQLVSSPTDTVVEILFNAPFVLPASDALIKEGAIGFPYALGEHLQYFLSYKNVYPGLNLAVLSYDLNEQMVAVIDFSGYCVVF